MSNEIIFRSPYPLEPKASYGLTLKLAYTTFKLSFMYLLDICLDKPSIEKTDEHIHRFAKTILKICNATLEASGRDNIDLNQSYIYMSNHASFLDIPVLFEGIPQSIRMVAKSELFYVPLFSQALRNGGFIRIDRKNRRKAISQLENAKEQIAKGVSVWISPEGTRSRDGTFGQFKKGGFHLAVELGIPIIPVWIDGTRQIIKPDTMKANSSQKVSIKFGKPVPTQHLFKSDIETLSESVRQKMLELKNS